MNWQVGALLLPIVVHIAAMLVNAAFAEPEACGDIAALWCGSPFESIASSFATDRSFNFFTLGISVISGLWKLLTGLVLLDYDMLKAQEYGAWAALGDGIRIVSGIVLLGITMTGAVSIFRR